MEQNKSGETEAAIENSEVKTSALRERDFWAADYASYFVWFK